LYVFHQIFCIICLLSFSNRLTSHQCLEHPWLSQSLGTVEKLPSSCQANAEVTVSCSSTTSSRSNHLESNDIKSPIANVSVQHHNLETNRVNGTNCSYGLSNGNRCEKDGDHNSENKVTSLLFSTHNSGTTIIDGNHKADSDENEELPVQKRPKNSTEDRRSTSYPVASCLSCAQCGTQCCHLHTTSTTPELLCMTRQHHHSSINNSPVEIIVDRGITC